MRKVTETKRERPEGEGFAECVGCGEPMIPMFGDQSGDPKCFDCHGEDVAGEASR